MLSYMFKVIWWFADPIYFAIWELSKLFFANLMGGAGPFER